MEIDPTNEAVTAELTTNDGTQEYRFIRDTHGRLSEAHVGTVALAFTYDARGDLVSIRSGTSAWRFTYSQGRLRTLASGENVQSCRWENVRTGVRASSFSDFIQIKVPVVTLQSRVDPPHAP